MPARRSGEAASRTWRSRTGASISKESRPSSGAGGGSYGAPGSIVRPADSPRRRASIIWALGVSTRTTLADRPVSSATSVRSVRRPSSSKASKTKCKIRSRPTWSTRRSRAGSRCLRSTMANIGACRGFSGCSRVKWAEGNSGKAETRSFSLRSPLRRCRMMVSDHGWNILTTRALVKRSASSFFRACTLSPSSGMGITVC